MTSKKPSDPIKKLNKMDNAVLILGMILSVYFWSFLSWWMLILLWFTLFLIIGLMEVTNSKRIENLEKKIKETLDKVGPLEFKQASNQEQINIAKSAGVEVSQLIDAVEIRLEVESKAKKEAKAKEEAKAKAKEIAKAERTLKAHTKQTLKLNKR